MTKTDITAKIAGDHGSDTVADQRTACISLEYETDSGWQLIAGTIEGHERNSEHISIWSGESLRYEITEVPFLSLENDDQHQILDELGEDLPEILETIAAGHTVEWDDGNILGSLDESARRAQEILSQRIQKWQPDIPVTYSAEEIIEDWPDGTDPKEILEGASSCEIRIWGGIDAIAEALEERNKQREEDEDEDED